MINLFQLPTIEFLAIPVRVVHGNIHELTNAGTANTGWSIIFNLDFHMPLATLMTWDLESASAFL